MKTTSTTRTAQGTNRLRAAIAGLALAATLVTGCAAGGGSAKATTKAPVASTGTPAAQTDPAARPAQVVRTDHELVAYASPDTGAEQHHLSPTTELGSATALLITGYQDGWVQVLVPGRPTGATAWLPAQGLDVRTVTTRIEVNLAARTLTLLDEGKVVLTTPVAVGAPDTPTPAGTFSITDKLDTQSPNGPYGRYAIGLSGRSEVLTEFGGGDGQIGIHGTDDPSSIGKPVSHGCIRVPNEVMDQLNAVLPLGTPVVVG